jgi:hypothetical protein
MANSNSRSQGISENDLGLPKSKLISNFFVESNHINAQISLNNTPVPPEEDGKYGWIVVGAAFLCHFVSLGYLYSFGNSTNPVCLILKVSSSCL